MAPAVSAGDFFEDGTYAFDANATQRFDFEDGVPEPLEEGDPPLTRVESDTAFSGDWIIEVPQFEFAGFIADIPPVKRSYRVSFWVRGVDALGRVTIVHNDGNRTDEYATIYPTGRMTSDGWVELAQSGIKIDGARSSMVLGAFNAHTATAEIDAFEVVPEGDVAVVNPTCQGTTGAASCEKDQVCIWNECKNVSGFVPPIPDDRETVREYLENRIRYLYGPYLERTLDLPRAIDAMERMKTADDPWTYWNGFLLAIRRLHDWHTRVSSVGFGLDNPRPINVCFIEGDADLTQATAPKDAVYNDIIVSHIGANGVTLGLSAGDRLVSVDGQHPIDWARKLTDFYWSAPVVSNHRTFPDHAADMRSLISRFAHEIEVIRCDPMQMSCGGIETIVISDLPLLPEEDMTTDFVACDNRPLRHLADSPENHAGGFGSVFVGLLNESNASENIYGVEWESLSTTNGSNGVGANLSAAVQTIVGDGANGVILDHRTGNGGTIRGADIIWDWAVQSHPISYMQGRPTAEMEQPTQAEGVNIYDFGLASGLVDYAGGNSASTIPIAFLTTRCGSASDWLPLGLKGEPNVMIFGPYETQGAFSTRFELGYTLGMGYVLASADTYLPDGSTINGFGVEPDVVVFPKQSDLLVGIDTVHETALAWVRANLP